MTSKVQWFWMLILAALGAIFFAHGIVNALRQHVRLNGYEPTSAVVLSSRVDVTLEETSDGTEQRFHPRVSYEYVVADKRYVSDRVFVIDITASESTAKRVASENAAGAKVVAWYDPAAPERSFLFRHGSFKPYLALMASALFLLIVGVFILNSATSRRERATASAENGWHRLIANKSPARTLASVRLAAVIWFVLAMLPWAHFYVFAYPIRYTRSIGYAVFGGVVGIILFLWWIALSATVGRIRDCRLLANSLEFEPGDELSLRAQFIFGRTFKIASISVSLICETAKQVDDSEKLSKVHEDTRALARDLSADVEMAFDAPAEFTMPAEAAASSPPKHKTYPRIDWRISVDVEIPDGANYRTSFPITVKLPVNA